MKRFIAVVFIFTLLAVCSQAMAQQKPFIESAEYKAFHFPTAKKEQWLEFTQEGPELYGTRNNWANTNAIKNRLIKAGYSAELLYYALDEHYTCNYVEYGQNEMDFFPHAVHIVLYPDFPADLPHSRRLQKILQVSGLEQWQGVSLIYAALSEHIGCLYTD